MSRPLSFPCALTLSRLPPSLPGEEKVLQGRHRERSPPKRKTKMRQSLTRFFELRDVTGSHPDPTETRQRLV